MLREEKQFTESHITKEFLKNDYHPIFDAIHTCLQKPILPSLRTQPLGDKFQNLKRTPFEY
jgi:hypothetical protein